MINLCDFCAKEVLDRQAIFSTPFSTLIHPRSPIHFGNLLVIPNRHVESMTDLSDEEVVDMKNLVKKVYALFQEKYDAVGYNLFMNVGKKAGQEIMHNHWHIFIRYEHEPHSPFEVLNGTVEHPVVSEEQWTQDYVKIKELLL